jgi:dephospho-CoA kinase
MKWYGLTGGLGSGKSTVVRFFRDRGVPVIDADQIAHEVVQVGTFGLKKITEAFGGGVLNPDGSLDRQKLAQTVFQNRESLQKLEAIIHPLVQAEVSRQKSHFANQGQKFAVYDVPLLYEKKLSGFDGVIVVSVSPECQRARVKSRDGLTDAQIDERLKNQLPLADKVKQAQFILSNEGSLEQLEDQVEKLLQKLG